MIIESTQWATVYRKMISKDGFLSSEDFLEIRPKRFSLFAYLPMNDWALFAVLLLQFSSAVLLTLSIIPNIAAFACFVSTSGA